MPFSGLSGISEDYENETFIWGTTIRQGQASHQLQDFLQSYTEPGADEAKYVRLIREVSEAPATACEMLMLACSTRRQNSVEQRTSALLRHSSTLSMHALTGAAPMRGACRG